jgi:hypothetical protein
MARTRTWIAVLALIGGAAFAGEAPAQAPPSASPPAQTAPATAPPAVLPDPAPPAEPATPPPSATPSPAKTAPDPAIDTTAAGSSPRTIMFGLIGLLIGIVVGGAAFHFYRSWRLRAVERDIAQALQLERIKVADVADEIAQLQSDFIEETRKRDADHRRQTKDLAARLAALQSQKSSPPALDPDQLRSAAAIACVDDALNAMGAPDVGAMDEALGLRPALESTRAFLGELQDRPAAEFATKLLTGLERGLLDHGLSTAGLLDTYFADRPAFRHARAAYRALESLLLLLLHNHGVQIVRPSLLSVISAAEIPSGQSGDRRNLRNVPAIRQAAARIARGLDPSEFLIVDCPAPGWVSSGPIGRRQPHIAIFEPASWT